MGKCSACRWYEEEKREKKENRMKCKNPTHIKKEIKDMKEKNYICLNSFASDCVDFENPV